MANRHDMSWKALAILGLSFPFAHSLSQQVSTSLSSLEPSIHSIEQLNRTVHGRLHRNTPYALSCFSNYEGKEVTPHADECAAVQANFSSLAYRSPIPGSYDNTQVGMCQSDPKDQCELDNKNPYNQDAFGHGVVCRQGSIPDYYLQIEEPRDVQAAYGYAKTTGKRLIVKNSGHDYMSRSSLKGSLALWTRHMTNLAYHDAFLPEGCGNNPSSQPVKAITTGAGANCGDAYAFAEQNNVTILCGYSKTVGISGGWVQGGGHSVLSNMYGLGTDRVLQFKVVTPDGHYRIANAHQNQDLFWALRGGGGSTFGVVTESTHLVEDNFPVVAANFTLPNNKPETILGFMQLLVDDATHWADDGWGGLIINTQYLYVNPKLSLSDARKSTKKISDWVESQGGYVSIVPMENFHEFVHKYISKYPAPAGTAHFPASRLISREAFESEIGRAKLMDVFKDQLAHGGQVLGSVDVPISYKHEANSTSATPGWYKSVWHVHPTAYYTWNSTFDERIKTVRRVNTLDAKLRAISPDTGSYLNEANPFNTEWKEAFWGLENYNRLLSIKHKYDPYHLLNCQRCVGWKESDQDACLTPFENAGVDEKN